jgi:hypothetical protein
VLRFECEQTVGVFRDPLGQSMKKERRKSREAGRGNADEILPEYDFSHARPNKYASRYAAGSMVVVLEPDGVSPEHPFRSTLNK